MGIPFETSDLIKYLEGSMKKCVQALQKWIAYSSFVVPASVVILRSLISPVCCNQRKEDAIKLGVSIISQAQYLLQSNIYWALTLGGATRYINLHQVKQKHKMCFSRAPQDMSNLQGVAREENVQAMEVSSHLVTAEAGEDVRMKILSFCRQRPGHIAILSASGTFSSVTIEDPSMAGMTQTYEWGFSVLSVSGIFMPLVVGMVDNEGRPGGINVIIGRQDGRVVGGRVAGPLIAASPVQVVMLATDPENAD